MISHIHIGLGMKLHPHTTVMLPALYSYWTDAQNVYGFLSKAQY